MIELYIAEFDVEGADKRGYRDIFHFALCTCCKQSWKLTNRLDQDMDLVQRHVCCQKILAGPIELKNVFVKPLSKIII